MKGCELMLTALFIIMLIIVFGKILILALKAAWGIGKIVLTVIFLPVILIIMAISGLLSVAFTLLVFVGIISLIAGLITG